MWRIFFSFALLLAWEAHSYAGTAILKWDPYPESPYFKELRIYRGAGSLCGLGSVPLQPLMTRSTPFVQVVIPKAIPPLITPTTFTDVNAPDTIGMICYELTAVDVLPSPVVGGVANTVESIRSNRAIKFVQSPVITPTQLEVIP